VLQGAHNFVLYTSSASAVTLVLFQHHDLWHGRSTVEIPLDPQRNRTGDLWHIAIPGLHHDLLYGAVSGQCVANHATCQ
jgi:isoamylase